MPDRPLDGSPAVLREHVASLRASVNRLRAERNEAVRARERERIAHRDTRRELARARDEAERLRRELERLTSPADEQFGGAGTDWVQAARTISPNRRFSYGTHGLCSRTSGSQQRR